MAKEKRTPHKVVMTEGEREIIRGLLSEYDIQSAQDIQDALKDLYLASFEATKKWTQPLSNWAIAYGELCIMYAGRTFKTQKKACFLTGKLALNFTL